MYGGIVNFTRILDVFSGVSDTWAMWHREGATLDSYLRGRCSDISQPYVNETRVDPTTYVPSIGERVSLFEVPRDAQSLEIVAGVISGSYLAERAIQAGKVKQESFGQGDGRFGGIQSISIGGVPLPICYGETRTGGNIVDSFETEYDGKRILTPLSVQDSAFWLSFGALPLPDTGDYFENVVIAEDEELNRSRSTLNTRAIICAGPVRELVASSIKIDDQFTQNFPGIDVYTRLGRPHQSSIPGFNQITNTVGHSAAVTFAVPYTFTTTTPIDELGIVLAFPKGVYRVNSDGFKRIRPVDIKVEARVSGTTDYELMGTFTNRDYAPNPVEYRVRVGPFVRAAFDFRISRLTADDTGTNNFSNFDVEFVNEISHEERNHPGVAQLALKSIPGDQISAIHPTNYTVVVKGFDDIRMYTSDTEFTVGWTDNPAWCCGHFLTSPLNGIGAVFSWDDIDIPNFILWAEHNDELVGDGDGGLEKRATFNRLYDQSTSAFQILQDFALGTGVGLLYSGSKFGVVIDKPRPRTQIFNEANIIAGTLKKIYFPTSELPTRVTVNFKNKELDYESDSAMQEDPNIALGLFQRGATFDMEHITRPGHAAREARRVVLTNTFIRNAVEFSAGIQAASVQVGDRIGVASFGLGIGLGSGMITHVGADLKTLHLDDDVTFEVGKSYRIAVQHVFDGAIDYVPVVNPGNVTTNIVNTVHAQWTRVINAGDKYSIGEESVEILDYRVDSTELAGFGAKFSMKISAGAYDERVYDLTPESNQLEEPGTIPNRDSVPGPVLNLEISYRPAEAWSEVGRRALRTIEVTWDPPKSFSVDHYVAIIRVSGTTIGSWDIAQITQGTYVEITNGLDLGEKYRVAVIAVSPGGLQLPISGIDTTHEVEVF